MSRGSSFDSEKIKRGNHCEQLLIIFLMNPNYLSPRNYAQSHAQTGMPFYHPQKELHANFNVPTYAKSPTSGQFSQAPFQPSSKSYIVKPQYQPIKNSGNNSGYLKSSVQSLPSHNNINAINQIYGKNPNQMVRSSFHDSMNSSDPSTNSGTSEPKALIINTPPRRQPRYSQPANYESPFDSTQDTKASFIPYSKKEIDTRKDQSYPQVHFYKKQKVVSAPERIEQKQSGREWLKQSSKLKKNSKSSNFDNFQIIKNLGKGKYGQVYLARQKRSGFIVALKMIEKNLLIEEGIVDQFLRQIKIQMFLCHPNIIKLYGCFDDEKSIYIILEVAMGGQLFEQLKRSEPMPETKVASIMKQVCTAVDELHSVRVIHRDIKPENIVAHEGVYKLCDFGWSVHLDNKMRTTFCGTPLYVCPQILKGNQYDQKIDIWSLGIMTYEMLVGQNPFKISKEEELIKIIKEQISIPSYVYVSKQARDFLDKCLQKNPTDRVTIKQIVNHDFFTKNAEKEKTEKKMTL